MRCGGLRAARVVGGRPLGGGLPPLQGASGVRRCPSPSCPSLGADSRDPLPVCPGHGWCGHGGPSTSPTACAFASRRCGLCGWREGVPGAGALRRCEGRLRSGARPSPASVLRAGCRGPLPTCCGRGCAGVGAQQCPFGLHALRGAACRGGGGRPSRGGWPSTVVRGVWCQALSLSRLPSLDAGGQDPLPVCPGHRWCWHEGPSTDPTACALASRRCALWGRREGVPGGVALRSCEGRLRSGARPPPAARPQNRLSGSATHLLWARVCGRGGPALSLWLACPAGGCVPRGGGRPAREGWPSTVLRGVWCQALPPPRPPVPWGGRPGFSIPCCPGAVGLGVGTQHRPHSVRSCEPSLRAVGMEGGRPRGRRPAPL